MVTRDEKNAAVESNQMMIILMVEELATRSPAQISALTKTAYYKKNLMKRHIQDDTRVLDYYYDQLESYIYRPTLVEKIRYSVKYYCKRLRSRL